MSNAKKLTKFWMKHDAEKFYFECIAKRMKVKMYYDGKDWIVEKLE